MGQLAGDPNHDVDSTHFFDGGGERTCLLFPIFIIQMKMKVVRPLELDIDFYDVTLVCEDEQEEGGGAQLCG